MATELQDTGIPSEVMADFEEISRLAAKGEKPSPELERRIRERSERVREQILQKHGVVTIGADIIREMRDGG